MVADAGPSFLDKLCSRAALAARVAARALVADTPIEVHVATSVSAANEAGD